MFIFYSVAYVSEPPRRFCHYLWQSLNGNSTHSEMMLKLCLQGLQQQLAHLVPDGFHWIAFLPASFNCHSSTLKPHEVDDIGFSISQHNLATKPRLRGHVCLCPGHSLNVENHSNPNSNELKYYNVHFIHFDFEYQIHKLEMLSIGACLADSN